MFTYGKIAECAGGAGAAYAVITRGIGGITAKREVFDMSDEYEWRIEYKIGVESIDKEHRELFSIINKLLAMEKEGKDSEWICSEGIKFFKDHADKHFKNEEAYMKSIGYKRIEEHKLIHRDFKENVLPALEEELERTDYSERALNHFLGVCTGWLIGHTLTEDMAIAEGKENMERWKKTPFRRRSEGYTKGSRSADIRRVPRGSKAGKRQIRRGEIRQRYLLSHSLRHSRFG